MAENEDEVLFSSGDEGENTLQLVNDNDEVIGHILDNLPSLQDVDNNIVEQVTTETEIEMPSSPVISQMGDALDSNYEPPPFPSDDSGESDNDHFDYYETVTDDERDNEIIDVLCLV